MARVLRMRVFAGPNGSGKSRMYDQVKRTKVNGRYVDLGHYLNPDLIAKELPLSGGYLVGCRSNYWASSLIVLRSLSASSITSTLKLAVNLRRSLRLIGQEVRPRPLPVQFFPTTFTWSYRKIDYT